MIWNTLSLLLVVLFMVAAPVGTNAAPEDTQALVQYDR